MENELTPCLSGIGQDLTLKALALTTLRALPPKGDLKSRDRRVVCVPRTGYILCLYLCNRIESGIKQSDS